jgi:hypothetical protein
MFSAMRVAVAAMLAIGIAHLVKGVWHGEFGGYEDILLPLAALGLIFVGAEVFAAIGVLLLSAKSARVARHQRRAFDHRVPVAGEVVEEGGADVVAAGRGSQFGSLGGGRKGGT